MISYDLCITILYAYGSYEAYEAYMSHITNIPAKNTV